MNCRWTAAAYEKKLNELIAASKTEKKWRGFQRGFHKIVPTIRQIMILTGIGDEAGVQLDAQIKATRELGWKYIEMRAVEVPGFPKGNFHDIPDKAFDLAAARLEEAGHRAFIVLVPPSPIGPKKSTDPFQITLDEVRRCIPRMKRVGAKFVRIMSYKPGDAEDHDAAGSFPPRRAKSPTCFATRVFSRCMRIA